MNLAGFPAQTSPSGISFVTTLPAPLTLLLPIFSDSHFIFVGNEYRNKATPLFTVYFYDAKSVYNYAQ